MSYSDAEKDIMKEFSLSAKKYEFMKAKAKNWIETCFRYEEELDSRADYGSLSREHVGVKIKIVWKEPHIIYHSATGQNTGYIAMFCLSIDNEYYAVITSASYYERLIKYFTGERHLPPSTGEIYINVVKTNQTKTEITDVVRAVTIPEMVIINHKLTDSNLYIESGLYYYNRGYKNARKIFY